MQRGLGHPQDTSCSILRLPALVTQFNSLLNTETSTDIINIKSIGRCKSVIVFYSGGVRRKLFPIRYSVLVSLLGIDDNKIT